jgi:DNA modification methylase
MTKVTEKPELAPFISPQRNQNVPNHRWYSFKHGYSRDLVSNLIDDFKLSNGSWVLDPFCGSGTTLLTCKEAGINSLGFDILPFSVFLSNVKINDYNKADLNKQLRILKYNKKNNRPQNKFLPDIPLVNKAFHPDIKIELLRLKNKINNIDDDKTSSFFNLAFLSILESVSNTSKSGGFLRITNRTVSPDNVRSLFFGKVTTMLEDITDDKINRTRVSALAKLGDARKLTTTREFDAVITSPPYPNRHDYTRIYSLEMVFDFVTNNEELKKIRYETLRSHVEARKKYTAKNYIPPTTLSKLTKKVKSNGTNNPQVIDMLEGYFEDMYLSLNEMSRCLKPLGKAALVVSNVRFAGVNIPVDEILGEIGSQVGLSLQNIWVARYRGNSSQQMRDYKRKPSRESIVIWRKNGN